MPVQEESETAELDEAEEEFTETIVETIEIVEYCELEEQMDYEELDDMNLQESVNDINCRDFDENQNMMEVNDQDKNAQV